MQKSAPFFSHSRNTSNLSFFSASSTNSPQHKDSTQRQMLVNSSFRASSPSSKTKIRLVSPLGKDKASVHYLRKENLPPAVASPTNQNIRSSIDIQLGGKSTTNGPSNNASSLQISPVRQTAHPVRTFVQHRPEPQPIFKKVAHFGVVQTVVRHQSPIRVQSPPKIHINNKCFDLGSIKSQVIYVSPIQQRKVSFETPYIPPSNDIYSKSADAFFHNPNLPSQLVIQEQNQMEEFKESYESQMKEIKQLQKEIEDNNLQIKQLLKSSRVSKELNSSRASHQIILNPSQENFAAEVIEQSSKPKKVTQPIKHIVDEVSVQTDSIQFLEENSMDKNESRCSKFSITKNHECQIQLLCAVSSSKQTKVQTPKAKSEESIDSPIKSHQNQLSRYEVNVNLKASRTESDISPIKYSRYQIEFQECEITAPKIVAEVVKSPEEPLSFIKFAQEQLPMIKDNSYKKIEIEKAPPAKVQQKLAASTIKAETLLSTVSSGKRRINNNIYL